MLLEGIRNLVVVSLLVAAVKYTMDYLSSPETSKNPVESAKNEKFVPTHEWQVVKEGQVLPAGLHIKMDMTTGVKMAKLMDKKPVQKKIDLSSIRQIKDLAVREC